MIDIESELFTEISTVVRNTFPKAFVTGEYVDAPPAFPCVSFIEMGNAVYRRTSDSGNIENHASLTYEVNVYSNLTKGKKSQAKAIMAVIDERMSQLGFTRMMLDPVPNVMDASIYRMIGRYRGIADKDHIIYRR